MLMKLTYFVHVYSDGWGMDCTPFQSLEEAKVYANERAGYLHRWVTVSVHWETAFCESKSKVIWRNF